MSTDNLKPNTSSLVIMMHSYKGGTGKTALSINLAYYYSMKLRKKVLLIEQDIGGPSLTNVFHITPKLFWNDFYNKNSSLKNLTTTVGNIDIICASDEEILIPQDQSSHKFYTRQLERFKIEKKWLDSHYDIVIFDTHPGYNVSLINSIALANVTVLVSRPDADTTSNTIKMYNKIYAHFKSKKLVVIENQIPDPLPDYNVDKLDANIEKTHEEWNTFISDKKKIAIPLQNEIAFPLSLSKLLPITNPFYTYIIELEHIISELLE